MKKGFVLFGVCLVIFFIQSCSEDPNVKWENLSKQSVALYKKGKYQDAIKLEQEALSLAQTQFGNEDDRTLTTMQNMASSYIALGEYKNAEAFLTTMLNAKKKKYGEKNIEVADAIQCLALIRFQQKRFSESEYLYQVSLQIVREVKGEDFPFVASIYYNLGNLYMMDGKYSEAAAYFEKAKKLNPEAQKFQQASRQLETMKKNLPSRMEEIKGLIAQNKSVPILYWRLGNLLVENNQVEEAAQNYEKALQIKNDYIDALVDLSRINIKRKEYEKTLPFLLKAIEIQPKNTQVAYLLSTIYDLMGDKEKAQYWSQKMSSPEKTEDVQTGEKNPT